jgi:hypothetical protein
MGSADSGTGYDARMTTKVLFGFHAVTVRLKTAALSITEIHVDSTRRDARMRQFVDRARDAGARLLDSDDERLTRLAGSPRHQGVGQRACCRILSIRCSRRCRSKAAPRRCCWCSTGLTRTTWVPACAWPTARRARWSPPWDHAVATGQGG